MVIETDGEQSVAPGIAPPNIVDRATFLAEAHERTAALWDWAAQASPTDIKLSPPNLEEIDTWLINATECEPYLSTDYREMMEQSDQVLFGIRTCLAHLGVPKAIICIEENSPKPSSSCARSPRPTRASACALPG